MLKDSILGTLADSLAECCLLWHAESLVQARNQAALQGQLLEGVLSLSIAQLVHAEVAVALNNLAGVLTEKGTKDSWPQAKKLGKQALDMAAATLGPDHPKTAAYRKTWATA